LTRRCFGRRFSGGDANFNDVIIIDGAQATPTSMLIFHRGDTKIVVVRVAAATLCPPPPLAVFLRLPPPPSRRPARCPDAWRPLAYAGEIMLSAARMRRSNFRIHRRICAVAD